MIPTLTWSLRRKRVQWAIGSQRSGAHPGSIPRNPSGATPTSVNGTPLRVIVLPRMAGSRPKRRFQYRWLITAAGGLVGRSSSVVRARPWEVPTPSTLKKSPETHSPQSTSGCPSMLALNRVPSKPKTPDREVLRSRICSKTENGKPPSVPPFETASTKKSCCGFFTGSVLRMTASIRLKIAVFAPMPSVRVRITAAAKPGLFRRVRRANRRSRARISIVREIQREACHERDRPSR